MLGKRGTTMKDAFEEYEGSNFQANFNNGVWRLMLREEFQDNYFQLKEVGDDYVMIANDYGTRIIPLSMVCIIIDEQP